MDVHQIQDHNLFNMNHMFIANKKQWEVFEDYKLIIYFEIKPYRALDILYHLILR